MSKIEYLIRIKVLLISWILCGQLLHAEISGFYHQTRLNKLFGASVNTLLEDHEGYLWVGTSKGLYCYDGYELYLSNRWRLESDKLYVSGLQEDARHNLWVFTSGADDYKLISPERKGIDANAYLEGLGLTIGGQYLISVDSRGNLWIIDETNISYYDYENCQSQSFATEGIDITSLRRGSVATTERCFYMIDGMVLRSFDLTTHRWHAEQLDMNLSMLNLQGTPWAKELDLYVDSAGSLWLYSLFGEEIFHRPDATQPWRRLTLPAGDRLGQNAIRRIVEDKGHCFWIATDHRGLFCYDQVSDHFTNYLYEPEDIRSLASNNVNALFLDRHNTLWIGYFKHGMSYCQPEMDMLRHKAAKCGDIISLLVTQDGSRWIGTDGNGLWQEDIQGRQKQHPLLPKLTISDIKQDSKGNLWIAAYGHGLYRLDRNTHDLRHYDAQSGSLPHDAAQRLAIDGQDRIWVCSSHGPFYCLDPHTGQYEVRQDDSGNDLQGESLCYDRAHNMVVLGTFYGLWIEDLSKGKGFHMLGTHNGHQSLHAYQLTDLLIDDYLDLVWMGHHEGITVWDVQADSLYLIAKDEKMNGVVQSLQLDPQHNVWTSTSNGVTMIRPMRDAAGAWSFETRNFLPDEDVQKNQFNRHAGTSIPDGLMMFGDPSGYLEIDVQKMLKQVENVVEPRFASVSIGDSLLNSDQLLHLHRSDLPLRISFYTGNPRDARFVRFAYQLVGSNQEWIETNDNTITLLTLPLWKSELQLKAMSPSGQWSEPVSLSFYVESPWWMSWWMFIIYLLIMASAVVLPLLQMRRRHRIKVLAERKQMIHERQARLAEMKLQFFTNISHDLRTPLTLIISPLEQLLKEPLDDRVSRMLQTIHRNAQGLMSEITTLLDFRKLDVGAETLRLSESRDLARFLREECAPFNELTSQRHLTLRLEEPVKPILVSIDEDKMHKIIYNLLSNAFKYSPDGGTITISLNRNADGNPMVKVADQGCGVSDQEKLRIFDLFYQSKDDTPQPGSGLGLYIVRQYVELHNGKLWVEDNTPQGAVFCFTLGTEEKETAKPVAEPISTPDSTGNGDKHTIMVVDDNHDLCHFIRDGLSREYNVLCAYDGYQALSLLEHENVTLVVTDVMMPGIDGMELCRRIKTDLRFSHIPVIMLTAKTADQSVLEGLQQGADDYLTKPFNLDLLQLRIAKFIEWAQRNYQTFAQQSVIEPSQITITPLDEQFLQQALDVANQHLQDADFGVEEFAQSVGMSRSQLYKKLMAVVGKSPLDMMRTLRMKRAKQLLEQSQLQVSEIAYSVGYNTLKTFTENFKQEYSVTPTEYRRQHSDKE